MATKHFDASPTPINLLSWLLAVAYLVSGGMKLAGMEGSIESFHEWGYTVGFMYLIGAIEVVGAVLIILLTTRLYGAVLLMIVMLGAMYTHAAHQEWAMFFVPLVMLLLLGLVAWNVRQAVSPSAFGRKSAAAR